MRPLVHYTAHRIIDVNVDGFIRALWTPTIAADKSHHQDGQTIWILPCSREDPGSHRPRIRRRILAREAKTKQECYSMWHCHNQTKTKDARQKHVWNGPFLLVKQSICTHTHTHSQVAGKRRLSSSATQGVRLLHMHHQSPSWSPTFVCSKDLSCFGKQNFPRRAHQAIVSLCGKFLG